MCSGESGAKAPAHQSKDACDPSRIIVFGVPNACRPFMMKETNFSGSVEYITATSALSGITLISSDLLLLYSDQKADKQKIL